MRLVFDDEIERADVVARALWSDFVPPIEPSVMEQLSGIAIQAALTGHLVLTTLHTNDAAGAVSRLLYMGIEPFMLASSMIMAQAQRLFRKLCPSCKQSVASL